MILNRNEQRLSMTAGGEQREGGRNLPWKGRTQELEKSEVPREAPWSWAAPGPLVPPSSSLSIHLASS